MKVLCNLGETLKKAREVWCVTLLTAEQKVDKNLFKFEWHLNSVF